MPAQIRTNLDSFYRHVFVGLFVLLGVICVGIVGLDHYTDLNIIATGSEFDDSAISTTLMFMGTLGLLVACLMIFLMREKRRPHSSNDRRKSAQPFNYANRRSYVENRRSK